MPPRRSQFITRAGDGRRRRRAFSFIELLVVVGIIALLAGLLMPAVSQARRQAKMTSCASQLHQIHLASQSWKIENERRGNPVPMQSAGWREAFAPYVKDLRIYDCPEDHAKGASRDDGATSARDPGDVFIRVTPNPRNPSAFQDMPMKEGPWVVKKNDTGDSYELWLEHQFVNNGAKAFDDVGLKFTKNPDGSTKVELISRQPGHLPYRSDVYAGGAGGAPEKLFNNVYGGDPGDTGTEPGATITLKPAAAIGVVSDYGLNVNLKRVDGDSGKVLGMDFEWETIDPAMTDFATTPADSRGRPRFARHGGYANILYGDGSVRAAAPSRTNLNPAFGDNRLILWE